MARTTDKGRLPHLTEANEKGFLGTEVDPTPDKNYTVAGVTKDAPTPETDAGLAAEAREASGLTDAARDAGKAPKK